MPRAKKNKYPPAGPVRECEGFSIKIRHQMQPKNYAQEMYIDSLRETPFTICSGPAGCGKTWLVTYAALEKLLAGQVERIIITRPVVEAGENLGFLPGTLEEKLDPYLIPIVDAIKDHIGPLATKSLMESGKIEIAPLAFMRGRSFRNCLPADHQVLLSTGEWVVMEELLKRFESGESLSVKSYNVELGTVEDKQIQTAFKQPNQYKKLVKLTLTDGTVVMATPDHKLFTNRGYVPVDSLTLEDKIIGLNDASPDMREIGIAQIEFVDSDDDVYDIMVADNHNFFTNGGVLSSNCFVVLDEAQNTTVDQMRMFVTRMGNHSYFCVNGDISQSDLEKPRNFVGQWENGLEYIIRKLAGRDAKINYIEFHNRDVIRSEMVKKILILLDAPDERPRSVDMHNSNGARAHLAS